MSGTWKRAIIKGILATIIISIAIDKISYNEILVEYFTLMLRLENRDVLTIQIAKLIIGLLISLIVLLLIRESISDLILNIVGLIIGFFVYYIFYFLIVYAHLFPVT